MTTTLLVQQVLNGLLDGVYYLLIALGLSLIFSLGGIVNLAHGGFFAIGAYLTVTLADYLGFGGAFVAAFTKRYNKPPENQAWGDYIALKILAQSMNDVKSAEAAKLIEHWEKGAKFDLLKTRPGYFRAWDHQLMHEMYAVEALKASELKNQWDIYKPSPPVPGANEDLEAIAPTKEENACTFA